MKESQVIIAVEGGVVVEVLSNVHDLDAIIVDYDAMEDWGKAEKEADGIRGFVHTQREEGNTATEFVEIC